jgi:hypothetical protein
MHSGSALTYDGSTLLYDSEELFHSPFALIQRVYESLGPWFRADESGDLLDFVTAAIGPLSTVDGVARDTEAHVGWGTLLDVDVAPNWALPWLAQFVGVTHIRGMDDASQRIRIKEASGFQRGTPAAIIGAARQHLTGTRRVELYEREGSPWVFRLRTYLSETPNSQLVQKAVEELKPAGIVFNYEIQEGLEINGLAGTIDDLAGTIDSYDNIIPV